MGRPLPRGDAPGVAARWLPALVCLRCGGALAEAPWRELCCPSCRIRVAGEDGVFRFLTDAQRDRIDPFLAQYRAVRQRDGYRSLTPDDYRALPAAPAGDAHPGVWRVREQTYRLLLRRVVRSAGERSLTVLDLGAGNAWLSARLARLGHRPVAVDWLDDEDDGLGARKHYGVEFPCLQADYAELPIRPGQFDLVVFNGSLHYAENPTRVLLGAAMMLVPGGTLAVMDSPCFRTEAAGQAMVARKYAAFEDQYGLARVVRRGQGYLTHAEMATAARRAGLEARFHASGAGPGRRVRRAVARLALGREPAAFGLWVAR